MGIDRNEIVKEVTYQDNIQKDCYPDGRKDDHNLAAIFAEFSHE